jgi:hypothetical protein
MDETVREGKYIYCIIAAEVQKTFGLMGIGSRSDELYTVCFKDIAAVVSNCPIKKYSVSRENMLAHEKAIEKIMNEHTVLPVRFATIAEDEKKVNSILEKEYDKFKNLLIKMSEKKELGLKTILKEDVIYKVILNKYKDIKNLKEQLDGVPPEKTYFQRMKIGEMVENALQKEKEYLNKDILDTLSQLAVEVKNNNSYYEMIIVNAAFLVEKHKEAQFYEKVNILETKYSSIMKFKYIDMVPPFNFVNLVINI